MQFSRRYSRAFSSICTNRTSSTICNTRQFYIPTYIYINAIFSNFKLNIKVQKLFSFSSILYSISIKMIIVLTFMSLGLGFGGISALPSPGLLRVPRVYNALVTSNQNLSPSRAFPVIQPVVHTTAVGYVPPFYYAQFAPSYPGPEAGRLPQEFLPAEGVTPGKIKDENLTRKDEETGEDEKPYHSKGGGKNIPRKSNNNNNNEEERPLSFYPNYHSLYYDPYLYSYNPFNAHLTQNPYIFDYQPQQDLAPALPPQGSFNNQHLLNPEIPEQEETEKKSSDEEKIPDVPPPPVPTSSSSFSSALKTANKF